MINGITAALSLERGCEGLESVLNLKDKFLDLRSQI